MFSDETKGRLAATIDQHLEGHHMGLFFDPRSVRPWWWLQVVREPYAWVLQRGRWELVMDRLSTVASVSRVN
jgi:hypothetical protein